jgi:hypothetical protein
MSNMGHFEYKYFVLKVKPTTASHGQQVGISLYALFFWFAQQISSLKWKIYTMKPHLRFFIIGFVCLNLPQMAAPVYINLRLLIQKM